MGITVFNCPARTDSFKFPCVYFIQSDDYIKIGKTNNLCKRIHDIQTHSPRMVECIAFMKCKSMIDATNVETDLHKYFGQYRGFGEWFESEAVMGFLEKRNLLLKEDWTNG